LVTSYGSIAPFSVPFPVGSKITVDGFSPSGYNGTFTVTSASTSSVTFANTTTGSVTTYGSIILTIYYRVIAGALPLGIQCTTTGILKGVPYVVNGINNVDSRFAIRASTGTVPPRFADRTFDFTVLSQVPPVFVTPAGNVGTFYDGAPITPIQIEISDPNPGDNVVISLATGTLPPGLSLSPTGLITG
jgi:hypothetical protein